MIGLIQRVREARVQVGEETVGSIGPGLLVLIGVERDDNERAGRRLLQRLLTYRVFPDKEGRLNLSLDDTGGGLMLIPQFTLAADTRKGTRASFSSAAEPGRAKALFDHLVTQAREVRRVETGRFGADMLVHLVNDGPVTFWLQAGP